MFIVWGLLFVVWGWAIFKTFMQLFELIEPTEPFEQNCNQPIQHPVIYPTFPPHSSLILQTIFSHSSYQ